MSFVNESDCDRSARILAAILLISVAAGGFVTGSLGTVLLVAGAVAVATGIAGWCPAYSVFGVSTKMGVASSCPSCEPDRRV